MYYYILHITRQFTAELIDSLLICSSLIDQLGIILTSLWKIYLNFRYIVLIMDRPVNRC